MKEWKFSVDGIKLRTYLDNEDVEGVIKELNYITDILINCDAIGESGKTDFQDFKDEELAFHTEEDDIDILELMLMDFWDRCDTNKVWVTLGIPVKNGVV